MDNFGILIAVLGMVFLLWKLWLWISWELEKKIFFRGVHNFREKPDESSEQKRPVSDEEEPKCG